jgi:hypothetical protein
MEYSPQDEFPHSPAEGPAWQESVFFAWYDRSTGIGGAHRVGHTPNRGTANCWTGIVTDDGKRFRRVFLDVSLRDEDREMCFGAGDRLRVCIEKGHPVLELAQPACEVTLTFHDFYTPLDLFETSGGRSTPHEGHRCCALRGRRASNGHGPAGR